MKQDLPKPKQPACYILITCEEPDAYGNMHVEMKYEGDSCLASYLLHGAQAYLDQEEPEYVQGGFKGSLPKLT